MRKFLYVRGGNGPFLLLFGLLCLLAFGGGGAREDIESLLYIRPLVAIALGLGLYFLRSNQLGAHRYLFVLVICTVVLMAIHLLPLPPSMWKALPGRQPIADAANVIGIRQSWRPLTLVPWRGLNSLFAMLIPLATLVIAAQIDNHRMRRTLPFLISLGVTSAILGLLQVIGSAHSPLYFYRITNWGAAVGLFANRNHAALLLAMLIPICAVYAAEKVSTLEQFRRRQFIALACVALVVPLILIIRSRAGFIEAFVGLGSVILLYRKPEIDRKPRRKRHAINPLIIPSAGVVLMFVAVSLLAGRATSLQKFSTSEGIDATRQVVWSTTVKAIGEFFPFGSGFGSFVETYQSYEPRSSLELEYINHAHNDYLELLLEAGLPGLALLCAALGYLVFAAIVLWRSPLAGESRDTLLMGRLGLVLLSQQALGSLVDYPLRTPMMAAIAVLAAVWVTRAVAIARAGRRGD